MKRANVDWRAVFEAIGSAPVVIPAGHYKNPKSARSSAHRMAGLYGVKITATMRDDGALVVSRQRLTRAARARRLFAPLSRGESVLVKQGRYANVAVARSKSHEYASRRGIKVRTRVVDGCHLMVRPVSGFRRMGPRRARRKVRGAPATPPFDAEADRLDELADLSFMHLMARVL